MARNPYDPKLTYQPTGGSVELATPGAVDTRGLSATLGAWQQDEQRKLEAKATERQQTLALRRQRELGTEELAQPDEDIAERFQNAYRAKAQQVMATQLKNDAAIKAQQLRAEHFNDPDGFARAFGEYTSTTAETFRDQDARFSEELALSLEEYGTKQFVSLAGQKAARERANQAQIALQGLDDRLKVVGDSLLNDPDQEKYQTERQNLEADLENVYEMGLISASQREKALNQYDTTMDREFLRGKFLDAVGRGDLNGAIGVVDGLLQGEWFERDPTNQQNRRLANELMGMLKDQMPDFDLGAHMDRLDRAVNLTSQGYRSPLGQEDINQIGSFVERYGTDAEKRRFAAKAPALVAIDHVNTTLPEVPMSQLPAYKDTLASQLGLVVPPDQMNHMLDRVDDRQDKIAQAKLQQDYAAIGWQEGMTLDNLTHEQLQGMRRRSAKVAEVSIDEVSLLPKSVIKDYSDRLSKAQGAGAVRDVNRLTNELMNAYGGDVQLLMGDVGRWERAGGGDVALPLMLDALGNRDSSARLSQLLTEGNAFSAEEVRQSDPRFLPDRVNKELFQGDGVIPSVVNNYSGADRQAMMETLEKAYLGLVGGEQMEVGDAVDELERLVQPLSPAFEYDTGGAQKARLPKALLDVTSNYDLQQIRQDAEALFENPEASFGLSPANSTIAQEFRLEIAPGGKALQVRNPVTDQVMNQPGTSDPITIPIGDRSPPGESAPPVGFGENLNAKLEQFSEGLDEFTGAAERGYNRLAFRGPPETIDAIYYATHTTPPETGGEGRVGKYMVPAEIEGRYSPTELVRAENPEGPYYPAAKPSPLYSEDGARAYAILLGQEAAERFPDDPAAQLAAYWFGDPDFVADLKEQGGEDWTRVLASRDMNAYQFVMRGIDQYGEGGGSFAREVGTMAVESWPVQTIWGAATFVPRKVVETHEAAVEALQRDRNGGE